jgi:tripartite-type tricarboxylate transporter receptor subunit TctC
MIGQIDFAFATQLQLPLVRAGSIKAHAVTGDTRSALAPDVPTFCRDRTVGAFLLQLGRIFCAQSTPDRS